MLSPELKKELESLPAIMSVSEVANALALAPISVYRMIYDHQLPAYKDESGEWNINRVDLIRMCSRGSNL